ncbi:MAG: rRNA pseudouridine synthase [Akkermansiaceae bacterium]|nr:rRNA pseudouridine synthase [Akkermansiaceae bacterium]
MSAEGTRLNKFLASCGIGSRRACDALVQGGTVEINGKVCLNPAERVGPDDHVKVEGKRMAPKETGVIAFHKPRGLVCSHDDEYGRDTIYHALPHSLYHFNHVGRLDRDSEGLLILTNDGAISQAMMHPSKAVEKEYIVTVNQPVLPEHLDLFISGIYVEKERLKAKDMERLSARRLRIILDTGQKRQIRMMCQALGYKVLKLIRIRIGSFELTDIPMGKYRPLDSNEIALLTVNPKRKVLRRTATKNVAKKAAKKTTTKRGLGTGPKRGGLFPVGGGRLMAGPKTPRKPSRKTADTSRPPSKKMAAKKSVKRAPKRKF